MSAHVRHDVTVERAEQITLWGVTVTPAMFEQIAATVDLAYAALTEETGR